jgi:hypothetical protein
MGGYLPENFSLTAGQAPAASQNNDSGSQKANTPNQAQTKSLLGLSANAGIQDYVKAAYIFAVGMVGIIATVVIMIGGLIWISSLGNANRVNDAKEWIGAAISGLALAMFSYMILYIINPDLVKFKPLLPGTVDALEIASQTGCCVTGVGTDLKCAQSTAGSCQGNGSFSSTCPDACRGNTEQKTASGDTCDKYGTTGVISFVGTTPKAPPDICNNYNDEIQAAATKYNINPKLLKAIAAKESTCNSAAHSTSNACGVMQMLPGTASSLNGSPVSCSDLANNDTLSVDLAAKFLDQNRQDNIEDWIAGYNGGYGTNTSANGTTPALANSNDCDGVKAYRCCKNPGKLAQTQDYVFGVKSYYAGQ